MAIKNMDDLIGSSLAKEKSPRIVYLRHTRNVLEKEAYFHSRFYNN